MGFAAEPAESRGNGMSSLAILDQTEKILGSEVFSRSERLAAFLRFTVTETLAGRGNTLKEQVIAASVYLDRLDLRTGNPAAVRSDARRLR
jgi:adenylate cyclase